MSNAWFEFNGVNSLDMHLRIENDISFSSPEADIDFIEVVGRDGDLAIDYGRLKSTEKPFPVTLDLPEGHSINKAASDISQWLKGDKGWFPLLFSGEEDHYYMAMCYQQFDIKETLKTFGKTVITFKVMPVKYRLDNDAFTISNGQALFNPEKRASEPLITVRGMGDVTLQNNGADWLMLRSVDGELTVDSQLMSVFKNDLPAYDKMIGELSPMFPILSPGENVITWTGNVTEILIEPRWEAIL